MQGGQVLLGASVAGGLAVALLLALVGQPASFQPLSLLSSNVFAITVPQSWQPGTKLAVQVPQGSYELNVPAGSGPGSQFLFQVPQQQLPMRAAVSIQKQQQLASKMGGIRQANTQGRGTQLKADLTSLTGMLAYERRLRQTMGKLRERWPTGKLNLKQGLMLSDGFIAPEDAADEEGWDETYSNGFHGGPPDVNNTNGVPGYTFVLNGDDLSVEDQGPGYYQPEDPEHWDSYMKMLRTDCFAAPGQPWRDHANCAALVKRSHPYENDDPWRFSGAFAFNPPFPAGKNATNAEGAVAPDANEYWNYGNDQDFESAQSWDGEAYVPPEEEEEEGDGSGSGEGEEEEVAV